MTSVTVVTPWKDHPELLTDYYRTVIRADEVIVIDNASTVPVDWPSNFTVIRNDENAWFTRACNQGLRAATGDIVLMLNNDVRAEPEWLDEVRENVRGMGLYGPSVEHKQVAGIESPMPYVEGWCVAGTSLTWASLGGWDEISYPYPYWEDVDLAFRAITSGIGIYRCPWPITHLSNTTSRHTPGAYDHSERNGETFARRVTAHLAERNADGN